MRLAAKDNLTASLYLTRTTDCKHGSLQIVMRDVVAFVNLLPYNSERVRR